MPECTLLRREVGASQGRSVQLEMKQEFWKKRKEYAKRVEAANSEHFRRVRCLAFPLALPCWR